MFAYLLRLSGDYQLSGDLMQESFTRYMSRYGRRAGKLTLLLTIARNAFLDAVRKRREESLSGDAEMMSEATPERQVIEKQAVTQMLDAIGQLKPVDRELIALLAAESFTYKEIGGLLGISEANVKVRVHRARLRLKAILNQGGRR